MRVANKKLNRFMSGTVLVSLLLAHFLRDVFSNAMESGMRSLIYIERLFNRIGDALGWLSQYVVYPSCCEQTLCGATLWCDMPLTMCLSSSKRWNGTFLSRILARCSLCHQRVATMSWMFFTKQLSFKAQAIIDLIGTVVFLLPFCLLVAWFGIDVTGRKL